MWNLYDVARLCGESSKSNFPVLVGTHDGKVLVNVYDWSNELSKYFSSVPNSKSYQHFRMSNEEPGFVYCLRELTGLATKAQILKVGFNSVSSILPLKINPVGLTEKTKISV